MVVGIARWRPAPVIDLAPLTAQVATLVVRPWPDAAPLPAPIDLTPLVRAIQERPLLVLPDPPAPVDLQPLVQLIAVLSDRPKQKTEPEPDPLPQILEILTALAGRGAHALPAMTHEPKTVILFMDEHGTTVVGTTTIPARLRRPVLMFQTADLNTPSRFSAAHQRTDGVWIYRRLSVDLVTPEAHGRPA